MTTRRITTPMLYGPSTPGRWLRTLVAAIDQAAAAVCCQQWQKGLTPCLQPAWVVRVSRPFSQVK